ncbi:MAG TPA: hypothetical protein VGN72_18060 [Tepidisphaeraceae bacterium]|jgi:hypothetical protein|nr:hypothetical protein [Tepidisphaeraceae bacterium]
MPEHTEESPSAHDRFNDAFVPTCRFYPGRGDFDLSQALLDEQEYRQTHCDCCGGVTAGTIVAGVHMQMCDSCLAAALWETLAEMEEGRAA